MNRADLLLSVLKDGKPHSRHEVFERVGFMLTNNAASELRARGYNVDHGFAGGVHTYTLLDEGAAAAPSSSSDAHRAGAAEALVYDTSPGDDAGPESLTLDPGQLSLLEAA